MLIISRFPLRKTERKVSKNLLNIKDLLSFSYGYFSLVCIFGLHLWSAPKSRKLRITVELNGCRNHYGTSPTCRPSFGPIHTVRASL